MAKNAKFTIYHLLFIKSNQAKVKYSILLLTFTLFSEGGEGGWVERIMQISSLLIPDGRYSEGSAQD